MLSSYFIFLLRKIFLMLTILDKIKFYKRQLYEEKQYKKLIEEKKNNWSVVKQYKLPCYNIHNKGKANYYEVYKGTALIQTEENGLKQRRLTVIYCPPTFDIRQTDLYADILIWLTQVKPVFPPRPAKFYKSFFDFISKLFFS